MNKARFSELLSKGATCSFPFPMRLVFGGRERRPPLPDLDLRSNVTAALAFLFPPSRFGLLRTTVMKGGTRRDNRFASMSWPEGFWSGCGRNRINQGLNHSCFVEQAHWSNDSM